VSFFLLVRLFFFRQFNQERIQAPRRGGVMLVCAAEVHIEAQPLLTDSDKNGWFYLRYSGVQHLDQEGPLSIRDSDALD
jgi:hypothetical protein